MREYARIGARGFGEQHRRIGGEVAVFAVLGAFDDERRGGICWQRAVGAQALERLIEKEAKGFFHNEHE